MPPSRARTPDGDSLREQPNRHRKVSKGFNQKRDLPQEIKTINTLNTREDNLKKLT